MRTAARKRVRLVYMGCGFLLGVAALGGGGAAASTEDAITSARVAAKGDCRTASPPASWSPKRRGCFAVSATIAWHWEAGSQPTDDCTGSLRWSARWTGTGSHHWIGDDLSLRIGPDFRAASDIVLAGPVVFDVTYTGSYADRDSTCKPYRTAGCGRRSLARYSVVLYGLASAPTPKYNWFPRGAKVSPYRSCGSPNIQIFLAVQPPWVVYYPYGVNADIPIIVASEPAGGNPRGITQRMARAAAARILATRRGGTFVVKAVDANPGRLNLPGSGRWTAKVVLKRVR